MQEAPRRLPPAGASSFWDRDHPSAPATRETPQSVATATTEVLVLGASRPHAATVIWLHGDAGDPPSGWLRAIAKLNMPWCKFLLPVAASRRQAAGEVKDDLSGLLLEPTCGWAVDEGGADEPENLWGAVQMVHNLIDREIAIGISSNQIAVGGMGQGAAVAILAALTYPRQLAGAAALAGYLPPALLPQPSGIRGPRRQGAVAVELDVSVAAAYLPIFMCHGSR
jgi:predicted esterase